MISSWNIGQAFLFSGNIFPISYSAILSCRCSDRYTREAGVRSLERKIGAICRAVAVKVAEGNRVPETSSSGQEPQQEGGTLVVPFSVVTPLDLALGVFMCPQFSERLTLPGVALGLAWTPLGGEIMFVEASRMEGEGQLTLTGQLGDVMKESAHLAISWLRANAKTYQLTNRAVTKDGPSAGVTIVTCLASLFSGRLVRSDVAMTGEITLRGLVLPVLAAHRAGVKRVILPKRNEKDLEELPANVRADLDFVMTGNLDEVLNASFDGGFPGKSSVRSHPQLSSKL
ncbi:Lon protease-like protein 2 [Goodea atripinnis]|uniref:Lon protease-like protein 2 n=1 Tax=Goodea atripinnis TaxID=208336 RepID=A0ABV0PYK1_9TELE